MVCLFVWLCVFVRGCVLFVCECCDCDVLCGIGRVVVLCCCCWCLWVLVFDVNVCGVFVSYRVMLCVVHVMFVLVYACVCVFALI